ncbi:hypothetical protein N434_00745 [Rhizobium sp. UGM030330-04]|nr:hypothetical protein N434_00745 [Rhizobium sp. UGM030330-04]
MMEQPTLRHPGRIGHSLYGKCRNTLISSKFRRAVKEAATHDLGLLFSFVSICHFSKNTGR